MKNNILSISNISKLSGDYFPPFSKSHTFRSLILSLYSKSGIISNRLKSDDVDNFVDIIKNIGFSVLENQDKLFIKRGKLKIDNFYDFKNSGTALRFMVSVFSLLKLDNQEVLITGDNQLKKRKIKNLLDSLKMLGLDYEFETDLEIPFKIKKNIKAGETRVSGKSSQFLSSLLLTLSFLEKSSIIYIDEINEKPYIDMTLDHLDKIDVKIENFNYEKIIVHPIKIMDEYKFTVPSDFSSATYIILATILSEGNVDIYNLDIKDTQGDKAILEIIKSLGCDYKFNKGVLTLSGTVVRGGCFDMNSTPDMLPALVFFLVQFPYYFEFINIEPIRYKETDRVQMLFDNLVNIGIDVKMTEEKLSFYGKSNLNNLKLNGANDHRIIMGATLLGMKINSKVEIYNIKNLNSSYPNYLADIEKIGVNVSCSS